MASSNPCGKTEFMGPAQSKLDSFQDLANYSLNAYWPHWNDHTNPESYLIPPIFYYKCADKSDEDFEEAEEEQKKKRVQRPDYQDPLVKHRESDIAEHIVYAAILQLIQEKHLAPFIAVQNLNIKKIKQYLPWILPGCACLET